GAGSAGKRQIRKAFTDWYDVRSRLMPDKRSSAFGWRRRACMRGRWMDSIGGARIAVDHLTAVPVDSIDDQLRALRRERDTLRRENRILKIAVAELERVSERDTLTPLFNRRYFLTAIHQRLARFARHAESAAVV